MLRGFYEIHLEAGTGPMVNPFPLSRAGRGGRANAHHNPAEAWRPERTGRYRPKVPQRIPDRSPTSISTRCLPASARIATGRSSPSSARAGRAAELLGASCGDVDPGAQLITVIRKGSRRSAATGFPGRVRVAPPLPGPEQGLVSGSRRAVVLDPATPVPPAQLPRGAGDVTRANAALGANWTLHDLRHTAAYRMAHDPEMPLTDVQWVLGHAHLQTTQLYVRPSADDVIASVRAHHARRGDPAPPPGASEYRADCSPCLFKRPSR